MCGTARSKSHDITEAPPHFPVSHPSWGHTTDDMFMMNPSSLRISKFPRPDPSRGCGCFVPPWEERTINSVILHNIKLTFRRLPCRSQAGPIGPGWAALGEPCCPPLGGGRGGSSKSGLGWAGLAVNIVNFGPSASYNKTDVPRQSRDVERITRCDEAIGEDGVSQRHARVRLWVGTQ